MPFVLDSFEIPTLEWVLRCYLADRPPEDVPDGAGDDVRAMFAAAEVDRRAVDSLLARLHAYQALPPATELLEFSSLTVGHGAIPLASLPVAPAA